MPIGASTGYSGTRLALSGDLRRSTTVNVNARFSDTLG
jgi:hypothetical protein